MFDKNVPEQVIKETTGHRSECVRVHKHTSETLQETASKTVSGKDCENVKLEDESSEIKVDEDSEDVDFLTYEKMLENVKKTKEELRKRCILRPG